MNTTFERDQEVLWRRPTKRRGIDLKPALVLGTTPAGYVAILTDDRIEYVHPRNLELA